MNGNRLFANPRCWPMIFVAWLSAKPRWKILSINGLIHTLEEAENHHRLEALIESSHSMVDSVGKLESSFIHGWWVNQSFKSRLTSLQRQEAVPQVVVNVGYDPLQQFREVIQQEVIDSEFEIVESHEDDDDDIESNTDWAKSYPAKSTATTTALWRPKRNWPTSSLLARYWAKICGKNILQYSVFEKCKIITFFQKMQIVGKTHVQDNVLLKPINEAKKV